MGARLILCLLLHESTAEIVPGRIVSNQSSLSGDTDESEDFESDREESESDSDEEEPIPKRVRSAKAEQKYQAQLYK